MTTPVSTAPGTAADLLAVAGGAVALGSQPAGATSDTAAGFFALVMQALHGTAAGSLTGESDEQAATPEQAEGTEVDGAVAAASAGIVAVLPVNPVLQAAVATEAALVTETPALSAATVTAVAEAGPELQDGTVQRGAVDAAAHEAGTERSAYPSPAAADQDTLVAAGPSTVADQGPDPVATTGTNPGVARTDAPAAQPQAGTPSTATVAPTTASAPAAAPATTAPAPAAAPVSVPDQVFGAVTNLVNRGNGTHRITMTLNPEQLGEVRVVMTVRDGAVHVRLAAGQEAQAALLEGSGELTRLLTQAGAADTRVVVRDLPVAAAASSSQPGTDGSPTPDLGAGTNQHQDQHARTRADHPATDGTDTTSRRLSAAGPAAQRPIETDTSTRATGLDVTM